MLIALLSLFLLELKFNIAIRPRSLLVCFCLIALHHASLAEQLGGEGESPYTLSYRPTAVSSQLTLESPHSDTFRSLLCCTALQGNAAFKAGDYQLAIRHYSSAIANDIDPGDPVSWLISG